MSKKSVGQPIHYQENLEMKDVREVIIIFPEGKPFEYYCHTCKQLRLSTIPDRIGYPCGNCGSLIIVKGEVGELDKWDIMNMGHDGEDK